MKKPKAAFRFTDAADRDIERCRLFLWRKPGGQPARRIGEIMREARRITHNPKLYPIESVHPVSGLEFRRKNVDRFVIVYAYLEPTPASPGGIVSIRSIRHGAEDDIFLGVEETRAAGAGSHFPRLALRDQGGPNPWLPG